jgi:hypothetical protein
MRPQTTPWWRPAGNLPRIVEDCEQIRTLDEECAQAVDGWKQMLLAHQTLCDALLADCTDALTPPPKGDS